MRLVWIALLSLLVLAPTATACAGSGSGSVAPLIDLQFPDKQKCKANDHSDCDPAPGYDQPFTMEGTLSWYWAVDNCEAGNLALSMDDIVISFPKFPRNPSWLELTMDPPEIHITFAQQWNLMDDEIDPTTQKIIVRETFPVKATITRVGEPTGEEMDRLLVKNSVVEVYAKAVSSQTEGFQPGFAFENFRLDASAVTGGVESAPANDAPAPAFSLLAVGLAALAVALRRR